MNEFKLSQQTIDINEKNKCILQARMTARSHAPRLLAIFIGLRTYLLRVYYFVTCTHSH